jgi:hypothetical protein
MKFKIFAVLALIMVALGWRADAQTNVAPVIRTNLITAAQSFREVNGQLYNTERSVLFQSMAGHCLEVSTNGLLIALVEAEPIWGRMDELPSWRDGDEYMGLNPAMRVVVGKREKTGKIIFLKNYFQTKNPAVTQLLSFRAMQDGTIDYNNHILEAWDSGTPHVVMVVTTNYPRGFNIGEK